MRKMYAVTLSVAVTVSAVAVLVFASNNSISGEVKGSAKKPNKAAIDRTRKTVQMLDNIYKQTIVLITDKYVHNKRDYPAGRAAVVLFKNISKSGSHTVRLIDATGNPYDAANVAKSAFEREGIKRLKAGANFYEQVADIDGKPQLLAITPVPVVMKKCIMCHDHYANAKKGEPVGAISYIVPIE